MALQAHFSYVWNAKHVPHHGNITSVPINASINLIKYSQKYWVMFLVHVLLVYSTQTIVCPA